MNSVIINIWLAVGILILAYISWGALESFNNKQLAKIALFILVGGFAACIMHLRTCLKDHAHIYKKSEDISKMLNRISGDLPH